jgi:hypothetical protein
MMFTWMVTTNILPLLQQFLSDVLLEPVWLKDVMSWAWTQFSLETWFGQDIMRYEAKFFSLWPTDVPKFSTIFLTPCILLLQCSTPFFRLHDQEHKFLWYSHNSVCYSLAVERITNKSNPFKFEAVLSGRRAWCAVPLSPSEPPLSSWTPEESQKYKTSVYVLFWRIGEGLFCIALLLELYEDIGWCHITWEFSDAWYTWMLTPRSSCLVMKPLTVCYWEHSHVTSRDSSTYFLFYLLRNMENFTNVIMVPLLVACGCNRWSIRSPEGGI